MSSALCTAVLSAEETLGCGGAALLWPQSGLHCILSAKEKVADTWVDIVGQSYTRLWEFVLHATWLELDVHVDGRWEWWLSFCTATLSAEEQVRETWVSRYTATTTTSSETSYSGLLHLCTATLSVEEMCEPTVAVLGTCMQVKQNLQNSNEYHLGRPSTPKTRQAIYVWKGKMHKVKLHCNF